jgi:hypothetical protein
MLADVPRQATIYITTDCTHFNQSSPMVYLGGPLPTLRDATIIVSDAGASVPGPLISLGDLAVRPLTLAKTRPVLRVVNPVQTNPSEGKCLVQLQDGVGKFTIKVDVRIVLDGTSSACGLLLWSNNVKPAVLDASIWEMTSTSLAPDYFRMATGNVYGTIEFETTNGENTTDLLLEVSSTQRVTVTPPSNSTFNLSELLEVYGDAYEIEWPNTGVLDANVFDPSELIMPLVYTLLFFGGLYISHT